MRPLALVASFVAGLIGGAATLAAFSFAMPVLEFGSGLGTFLIWLKMLLPYYTGTFVVLVGPFLYWQSCRPSQMQRKKKVLVASLLFIAVEGATVIAWHAYDYWFFAIFFVISATAAAYAAVVTYDQFRPSAK